MIEASSKNEITTAKIKQTNKNITQARLVISQRKQKQYSRKKRATTLENTK
jgi:hypothetical protein